MIQVQRFHELPLLIQLSQSIMWNSLQRRLLILSPLPAAHALSQIMASVRALSAIRSPVCSPNRDHNPSWVATTGLPPNATKASTS